MKRVIALALTGLVLVLPRSGAADGDDPRPLDGATIPAEKSGSPKVAEWVSAARVRPTRRAASASCRMDLVREWLRVKCAGEAFAISMLGGDVDGIAYWIDPKTKEGEVLLPLRRGGRHAFQFWKAGKDRAGAFVPEPTVVVQQYWLEGAASPVVTLH